MSLSQKFSLVEDLAEFARLAVLDSAEESPGFVLAQATCSFIAGGYPLKILQVSPRANTAKF